MRTRAAQIQSAHRRQIARPVEHRPHGEQLIERQLPVINVSSREAVGGLKILWRDHLDGFHKIRQIRCIRAECLDHHAAEFIALGIPVSLFQFVRSELHVRGKNVQFAPYKLKKGNWNSKRDELGRVVIKTLGAYAPDLPNLVEAIQVITPQDLETTYGFTGGHIYHGELALDQLFTMRPVLDWARYLTPVRGLYLCGSGTHPGNGLTGASGANAAKEIIRDLR